MNQAKRLKELEKENTHLRRLVADLLFEGDPEGSCRGKVLSPTKKRRAVFHVME